MNAQPNANGGAAAASLIGRILLSAIFIISGLGKLAAPAATKGYIASVGMPLPDLAYLAAIVVEVGFGLAVLVGYRTRIVATVLALFALVTAFAFHMNFGDQNQMIHFLKNVAIAGGFLQVAVLGATGFSIDAMLANRRGVARNA
ncbi:LysR family transcriptional regulator [Pandoraea terrae]|uniref:LysR family transcriptional regulator n=1 Tax=Pandoraea terrae TaxID=1537710 RepID=A0A5E4V7W6_9BURK|nr:DoxX family protein [Pandoraea terrae]VVE07125.1 LysR family transcriptional regulator [Pandoraea terrae]